MSALPPRRVQPRQSLLFSATIPAGIREVADLDANHVVINTLKPGEENTHEHVPQEYVFVSSVDLFPATVSLLEQTFEKDPAAAKVILFFSTARLTGLFFTLMQVLQSQSPNKHPLDTAPIFELHSRKSQGQRVKSSEQFTKSARGILCSSDVTARGVDFPGVTQVIQVGLPANGEQYIHRLGRTARTSHGLEEQSTARRLTNVPFLQVLVLLGRASSCLARQRPSSFNRVKCAPFPSSRCKAFPT